MSDNQQRDKLHKKIRLLESELSAIKGSRSYKLIRTAAVLRSKLKEDPAALTKKLFKTIVSDPRRLVRLAKGEEGNTGVAGIIANRVADYHSWIVLKEPNEQELHAERQDAPKLDYKPLISILTPVFDPPVDVLRELISSVLEQTYPHFELCLGNFGRSDDIKRLLDEYATRDPRVKVYEFKENLGISGNSNLILEKVKGEFVSLLDHDDTLAPNALYENVRLLNEQPYDFMYSDKDMVDDKGNRYQPLFKSDLSPETMLNANYFTHFNVMRTKVVRQVGGWDSKTDGAQDWDLFLKIMSVTERFAHIPKVLYHWRVIETSTAHSIETKPYALEGQRHAVQKYLDAKGLKARPYHQQTELLLHWDDTVVDKNPLVIICSTTMTDTMRLLSRLKHIMPKGTSSVVMYSEDWSEKDVQLVCRRGTKQCIRYEKGRFAETLNELLEKTQEDETHDTILFISDYVRIPREFHYRDFVGWLSIPEVGAIGVKVLGDENAVVDVGAVLMPSGAVPIFHGYPSYYQGYMGNVEWVRDLHVVSQGFFALKRTALKGVKLDRAWNDAVAPIGLMLSIGLHRRLVSMPKTVVFATKNPFADLDQSSISPLVKKVLDKEPTPGVDRYSNPNLHPEDPMNLITDNLDGDQDITTTETLDQYQHDALILARAFDLTHEEIQQNLAIEMNPLANPQSVSWFLPAFDAIYAGLINIFSFADFLNEQGLKSSFYILKAGKDAEDEKQQVLQKFPGLKTAKFIAITPENAASVKKADIGICTQWASAYLLAKSQDIKRKCYFIQDNEANFYPQGSISALVDLTYKLGFYGVANTEGLLGMYRQKYNGKGTVLKSVVSLDAYHPREDRYYKPTKPYKVFFYARPNMPRNAFELGLAAARVLKEQMGADIHIITAGAPWNPAAYGVAGLVDQLGKIPYDAVPDLYRSVDAGMMFMFSGHPGVTASELMASGCPTVVNEYNDATWKDLYQHEKTCLVSTPTASEIARNIRRCLEDMELRRTLIDGGLRKVESFYTGHEQSQVTAFQAIKKGR